MFKKRLLSGIVMMIIIAASFVIGGPVLYAINLVLALVAMFELFKAFKMEEGIFAVCAYIFCGIYYFIEYENLHQVISISSMIIYVLFILTMMVAYVIKYPKYKVKDMMVAFFGFFYVGILFSYLFKMSYFSKYDKWIVWLVIISAWGCDTFAYLVGKAIGKHKLCSKLSPKKSIEGAIGGIIGAALIGLAFAFFMIKFTDAKSSYMYMIPIICAVSSIFSQFGDLIASGIKRENDIKDYGKLIPGHGGIMDRFDSVIIVCPIVYYLVLYLF